MSNELDPIEYYEEDVSLDDYDMMYLFEDQSFVEKWRRVFAGLNTEKG